MSAKKTSRKKNKSSNLSKLKLIYIFILIFLFASIASALSYFIMQNENKNVNKQVLTNNILKNTIRPSSKVQVEIPKDKYEEYTEEFHKDYVKEIVEPIKIPIKKQLHTKEIKQEKTRLIQKEVVELQTKVDSRPKLAIIIDDVSSSKQKKKILDIGYKITMAFLPPTKYHKNSAQIAQDLPVHMIHFPMQATKAFKSKEKNTLTVDYSYEQIEKRVKQLRQWYPNAVYTNNHTGSVFTENEQAMDNLFRALKKYNFKFVDSRTTAKSVVEKYSLKYGMPYIVRNTFIDNIKDFKYIQKQLKKAIKLAKERGSAIAIGHPHSMTLKVLKNSKHLLKDVEVIYINELPYL